MRVMLAEGKPLRVSRATWPFPLPLSLADSSGASEGPRACPQPGVPAVSAQTPRWPCSMPSQVGPTEVPASLSRWTRTAHSTSLVSVLQGWPRHTPMCMHLHMPKCMDQDADLSYMWEMNGTDQA